MHARAIPAHGSSAAGGWRFFQSALTGALLLASLPGSPAWAATKDVVPDWVKAAAAKPVPTLPDTSKAVVLLDDTTYTVAPDGRATEHVRRVVKILRPQGRQFGYPVVWFDGDSKVLSMHVWSIDPAGHQYAMKDNELSEFSPPGEGALYEDERARVANPPGRDPGGIIAYEYDKRERPYLAETTWSFQDELPRLEQSFTLVLPQGYTYTTTWAHHGKTDAIDLENQHYRWEMNNEHAINLEEVPLSPSSQALTGRMTVHYAGPGLREPQEGTWKGIGEWYDGLSRDRLVATPEIAAKAAELTAGKTDFFARTKAISEFVQGQIRYFVVEMGIGGYQPHPAGDILRGRYGDCKDKATLLSSMLSTVGIHSALMMVDTERGVIDPAAPSIAGNHMIGAIEIPAGYTSPALHSVITAKSGKRYLIFDPTWDQTPFGQLERNLQGSYGVLLEGANTEVVELPRMSPDLNTVRRSGEFRLAADGTLEGKVIERRYGDLADLQRQVFGGEDTKDQQKFLDNSLGEDFTSVALTGLQVDGLKELTSDLTIHYNVAANHFASATGPLLMVRPRVLGSDALDVNRKERLVAVDLRQTMTAHDDFDIALPEGYTVDELPEPVKKDFGFAAYESSTEVRGNTLHFTRTYTQREITLPPSRYRELQRLADVIATDESNRAILKRTK